MKYLSILLAFIFLFCAAETNAQCSVTLSAYELNFSRHGSHDVNTGTPVPTVIDITVAAGCGWTASANEQWMSFDRFANGGSRIRSGTGNGQILIYISYNESDPRGGTITVNDKTIQVNQSSGCSYFLTPSNSVRNFSSIGGTANYPGFSNGTAGPCRLTYTTTDHWIQIGATSFTVAPSEGVARTGTITYHFGSNRTLTLTVNQEAGCFYSISQSQISMNAGGGNGTLDLITDSVCEWRAEANQDWINVATGSGTGGKPISYSVSANNGAARTGIINIGGQIFTVNQAGGKTRKRVRIF